MRDLTPGGTATMRLLKGETPSIHFYSTPEGKGQKSLVRQTGLANSPYDRTRLEDGPIVPLGAPPVGPFDPSLPRLRVTKVPVAGSKRGLKGGWRLIAVAGRAGKDGPLTTTTEPVAFFHGNNQHVEWTPPPEASPGITEWVAFVSEEAATEAQLKASTMREADSCKVGARRSVVKRYDRRARKRPTQNQTFVGRTRAPQWGPRRDLDRKNAPRDLRGLGEVVVLLVWTFPRDSGRGESLASERSEARTINGSPDRALVIDPRDPPRGANGVKPYLLINGVPHRVVNPDSAYKNRGFPLGKEIRVYGDRANDAGESDAPTILVQEDPPEEDTSGIEGPSGEMDPPVGIGAVIPDGGKYWKTYAYEYSDGTRRAAVPVRVEITSTEMALLEVPNPVNRIPNPAATARTADGDALFWTQNLANGVSADLTGKPGVATSGVVNDTTQFPSGSGSGAPYRQTDPLPVLTEEAEPLQGVLEVSGYAGTGGAGIAALVETRVSLADKVTILASRTTNGETAWNTTVGMPGTGATLVLDEATTDWSVRVGTDAGAGRSLTVRLRDLAAGRPGRKLVLPPEGSAELADPNAPPETPFHPGPVVAITVPKSAAPPPSFVPVQDADAKNGVPAGETATRSPANANTSLEVSADPLDGQPAFRARSDATGTRASAYYSRTYPVGATRPGQVNGSSLAARLVGLRFPLIPTRQGNELTFLNVLDANDNAMGFVRIRNGGALDLCSRNNAGTLRTQRALTGVTTSDLLDLDLIVGGGGTKNGRVSLVGSVGGDARQTLASIDGVNFTGRVPRQRRWLGIYEKDSTGRWEVYAKRLRVTDSGDVVEQFAAGEPPPPPDRPTGANGSYLELLGGEPVNQLYVNVPAGFEGQEYGSRHADFFCWPDVLQTLAVYARHNNLQPQDSDTVKLTLFDANGSAWRAPSPIPAAASGSSGGWQEFVSRFTPPPGHFRGRLEVIRTEPGELIVQLPLVADGNI